jgi:hypothetical protein
MLKPIPKFDAKGETRLPIQANAQSRSFNIGAIKPLSHIYDSKFPEVRQLSTRLDFDSGKDSG